MSTLPYVALQLNPRFTVYVPPPCPAPSEALLKSLFPLYPGRKFPGSCEDMEVGNLTETWYQSLQSMLEALNQTLHGAILCPPDQATGRTNGSHVKLASKDDYSYMYILFVMILFAAMVGSLILGYTKSRKVDKRSDPYHVYIKNRVSMI
nr:potassium voltage-gated channel subfamily E member 3 [Chrysemys picta bellii]